MTAEPGTILRAAPRRLAIPSILLVCILVLAGSIRWYRIDKESLAIDEYWALYLATGRGNQIFEIPYNAIVSPPPPVGFAGAPHWWHIWTGLAGVTHPPLYYLSLRGWIDLFGSADASSRSLSMLFSLGSIPLMFDAVRRTAGPWRGLIAASLMAFAPAQIDFAQIVRPYAMLIFFGLLLCDALIAIEKKSISIPKLLTVAIAVFLLAMTHYFSLGIISAAAIYAAIRLQGKTRALTVAMIAAGLLLALILWGPQLWHTRHVFATYKDFAADPNPNLLEHLKAILIAPILLCLDPNSEWAWSALVPLALFVYLLPLFRYKKSPDLLLWWLLMAGTIGIVVVSDLLHHSIMVAKLRYLFLMSPAIYALLAAGLPGRLGATVAGAILCCVAIYAAARVQAGPEPGEDWKIMTRFIRHDTGPRDVVCLIGYYDTEPAFDYFVVSHYGGEWNSPVVFLTSPPDQTLRNELAQQPSVWMIGHRAASETRRLLPGWTTGSTHGVGPKNAIWQLIPPASAEPK